MNARSCLCRSEADLRVGKEQHKLFTRRSSRYSHEILGFGGRVSASFGRLSNVFRLGKYKITLSWHFARRKGREKLFICTCSTSCALQVMTEFDLGRAQTKQTAPSRHGLVQE